MTDPARDEETRREVQAALGARKELGFEYEEAIAAGLLDRVNQLALMRASEIRREAERVDHEAVAEKESRHQRFVLGIISLGAGIPDHRHQRHQRRAGPRRRAGLLGRHRRGQHRRRAPPAPQTLGNLPNCLIAAHRPRR